MKWKAMDSCAKTNKESVDLSAADTQQGAFHHLIQEMRLTDHEGHFGYL